MKISNEDREMWAVFAETLRGAGEGALGGDIDSPPYGLCRFLHKMYQSGVLTWDQVDRMNNQLLGPNGVYAVYELRGERYIWPRGDVRPRIAACEFLAGLRSKSPAPKWS